MHHLVALVGRPNVGKSTLFNRLVGGRKAIAHNLPGVTRDNHYDLANWNGLEFMVVDTGGYISNSKEFIQKAIQEQVKLALQEAQIVLFLVDCRKGLTQEDEVLAQVIRRYVQRVILVINKSDNATLALQAHEFHKLGFPTVFEIAAKDGMGTGDLLDEVVKQLPEYPPDISNEKKNLPRIAIIGKPNTGKSSLVNTLLHCKKQLVNAKAHTTRDAVDSYYKLYDKSFILTDTAGIRRQAQIESPIEFYSVLRSLKAINRSDVCLLLIDAKEGLTKQDLHILTVAIEAKKGVIIAINKWDLIEEKNAVVYRKTLQKKMGNINYIPILFISVLEKTRIHRLTTEAMRVYENRQRKIKTADLNRVMLQAIAEHAPPAVKGKHIQIKYVTQLHTKTPSFLFFCNFPQYIKEPYKRYLEKKIRQNFKFEGAVISIFFRKK